MRLGHTARHCKYGKCLSVYNCGEEKHHPGEIDNRGVRCSIKKLKVDISKLEQDLSLKEKAAKQLNESLANKIENGLMQEDASKYTEAGNRKWILLRKHVFIIEKYCKVHFGGKIPPKHKLSDILSIALEDESSTTDTGQHLKQARLRGNPAKGLLEGEGISFPKPIEYDEVEESSHEISKQNLIYRCAPTTKDEEEEQLNMVIRQSALDSSNQLSQRSIDAHIINAQTSTLNHGHGQIPMATPFSFYPPMAMPLFPHLYATSHAAPSVPDPSLYQGIPNVPTFQPSCSRSRLDTIPVSDEPVRVEHVHGSTSTCTSESEVATATDENSQDRNAALHLIHLSNYAIGKHD